MKAKMLMALVAAPLLVLAACGGGGGETTVRATLQDTSIALDASSAAAGDVTFVAENAGTTEHELEVFRTDLAPDALPVEGARVNGEAEGLEEIGEIEEFPAGATEEGTFGLDAGSYVLICNIPGHYAAGMRVGFEVT